MNIIMLIVIRYWHAFASKDLILDVCELKYSMYFLYNLIVDNYVYCKSYAVKTKRANLFYCGY